MQFCVSRTLSNIGFFQPFLCSFQSSPVIRNNVNDKFLVLFRIASGGNRSRGHNSLINRQLRQIPLFKTRAHGYAEGPIRGGMRHG